MKITTSFNIPKGGIEVEKVRFQIGEFTIETGLRENFIKKPDGEGFAFDTVLLEKYIKLFFEENM